MGGWGGLWRSRRPASCAGQRNAGSRGAADAEPRGRVRAGQAGGRCHRRFPIKAGVVPDSDVRVLVSSARQGLSAAAALRAPRGKLRQAEIGCRTRPPQPAKLLGARRAPGRAPAEAPPGRKQGVFRPAESRVSPPLLPCSPGELYGRCRQSCWWAGEPDVLRQGSWPSAHQELGPADVLRLGSRPRCRARHPGGVLEIRNSRSHGNAHV